MRKICKKRVSHLKKQPQRTCIGCNTKNDKRNLVRIVKTNNGEINIDRTGKMDGRGAYLCNNIECLERAKKAKKLERVFEMDIEEKIYEELRGVLSDHSR